MPPISADRFSAGTIRNAPALVRCFCPGTDFAPPIESYRNSPAAVYGRSQTRLVSGYRKLTGFTRCGASRVSISSRSRSASRTSPNSNCSR
jgi:hypothetical protein